MSEKINQLIIHVKQYLNLQQKQSQQTIRAIQNQIDDKNSQIRDIFARNLDSVITHNLKYQQIISYQRKVQNNCQEFCKRIQKSQSLNTYDQQMICKDQKIMIELKNKKKSIQHLRQSVRFLKKAAISIVEERYSNAIKQLNLYKETEPTLDTPLKKTLSIFTEQIKTHLITLISNFWVTDMPKMLDVGTHCYNKVQLSTNEKTNIYQAFFGKTSNVRNSLIRKSSIIQQTKVQAPLRFLKKIKDEQILQKFILRINVEMNSLKQTKALCKEMKEEQLFQNILNKQIRKVIGDISKETPCENEADFKKLLATYIGFLLYRREVIAFFNIEGQNKTVLALVYSLIGQQAKALISKPNNIEQIMKVKSMLDVYHKVLQIVDLDNKSGQYTIVLVEIFKIYCSFSLEYYQSRIKEHINEDSLVCVKPDSVQNHKMIQQILDIQFAPGQETYNFTSFVLHVVQIFSQHYDRMVAFVKDSQLNKSQLHDQLHTLFQRIVAIYGGILSQKDQQPLQIAQGQTNLRCCQNIYRYFSNELQLKHQYLRAHDTNYTPKFQAIIVELRRRMREIVEGKIMQMMSSYEQENVWLPQTVNASPNDFIQWMLEFIKEVIDEMRRAQYASHEEMAFFWIGHIAHIYWQYLQQCKQYNLLTIYNLDLDLLFIYKFITKYFTFYPNLADKFKTLSQFYSFLLTNNIQDILDKKKRDITYPNMDILRIIPILKRYNRAKSVKGTKVRDLKKKDIQNIVKKLQIQYK